MKKIIGILICTLLILIGTGVLPITGAIKNFEKVNIAMNSTSMVTITVDDGGDGDFTSIQDAIDAAEDRYIIWVYSGTYQETLDIIDKDITLIGKPYEKDNPEDPKENPVIDSPPEDDNAVSILNAEVIFSNFTIKNSLQNGVYIETSCNNMITGNTITDNNYYGIWLEDSSDNTITGNTVTDNNYDGIRLRYSSDNTITGNNIDNNDHGIVLYDSSDNTITGNTITDNNYYGISIWDSSDNMITGNNITDNNEEGIKLYSSSDNNIITGNNIDDNYDGIRLDSSSDNTIKDNVFQSNGIIIYGDLLEHWTSHTIENNIADGRPIQYYKNTENVNVSGNTVQVILANCSNFMIQNLNLSNIGIGIQLGFSSDNTITGNTVTDNKYQGILLRYSSDNNTITGNNITDNNEEGIRLEDSSDNTITGNTIDNNRDGIMLYGYSSDNNIITGNTITDNNRDGIRLEAPSDNTITGNNIDNSGVGISLLYSSDNTITGNTITDNNYYGISIWDSSDNTITGNNITDNNEEGIRLYGSSDNTITGNTIDNNWTGIMLDHSSDNTITGNTITDNNYYGINLFGSSDNNTITGNDIDKNKKGINLSKASYNLITGNKVSNNGHGMVLDIDCSANTIFHNNFYQNEHSAKDAGTNQWDNNGSHGNYWDDYDDRYPDAQKKWLKGIWDTPYEIPGANNQDRYPLIKPYGKPKSKAFTFIDFYKSLISSFPFLAKILKQII